MDIRRLIEKQMTTERRLRSKCAAQVETLPEGKLSVQIVKGRTYYTLVKKGKRQYIGAGNRELVEKLRNSDSFRPDPSKEDKSFFDRLRDMF